MKFKISWKPRRDNSDFGRGRSMHPIIVGISTYSAENLATEQIKRFTRVFPFNKYFITPA